jgi:hypothetical protein
VLTLQFLFYSRDIDVVLRSKLQLKILKISSFADGGKVHLRADLKMCRDKQGGKP